MPQNLWVSSAFTSGQMVVNKLTRSTEYHWHSPDKRKYPKRLSSIVSFRRGLFISWIWVTLKICYAGITLRTASTIVRLGRVWTLGRPASFGNIHRGVVRGFCTDLDIEFLEKFIRPRGSVIDSKGAEPSIGCHLGIILLFASPLGLTDERWPWNS